MRFEQFGGLTFHEQWRKLEAEIARNEPPVIHESFKLDRSYVYGIGLKIVLDADAINQASIEAAIDRFIELGETDWVSPVLRVVSVNGRPSLVRNTRPNSTKLRHCERQTVTPCHSFTRSAL